MIFIFFSSILVVTAEHKIGLNRAIWWSSHRLELSTEQHCSGLCDEHQKL